MNCWPGRIEQGLHHFSCNGPASGGFSLMENAATYTFIELLSIASEISESIFTVKEITKCKCTLSIRGRPALAEGFIRLNQQTRDGHDRKTVLLPRFKALNGVNVSLTESLADECREFVPTRLTLDKPILTVLLGDVTLFIRGRKKCSKFVRPRPT